MDVVSCGMREGDRIERERKREQQSEHESERVGESKQDPRREEAGSDDGLEMDLGRQKLLWMKRTALPQQPAHHGG